MATISVTVPDGTPPRIVEAMATHYQYETFKNPNETKAEFANRMQKNIWKRLVLEVEGGAAGAAAEKTVRENPNDPLVTDPD